MSDDSGDEGSGPNWELLSSELCGDVLAALQAHLASEKEDSARGVESSLAASRAAKTIDEANHLALPFNPGPVEVESNLDFKKHDYWEKRFAVRLVYRLGSVRAAWALALALRSNQQPASQSDRCGIVQVEEEYEWLGSFKQAEPTIRRIIPSPESGPKILVVGCGNSRFSEDLFDAGWHDVTSIDFSAVVIERMREKNRAVRPEMKWEIMDMLTLSGFSDQTFDAVLDKVASVGLYALLAEETYSLIF